MPVLGLLVRWPVIANSLTVLECAMPKPYDLTTMYSETFVGKTNAGAIQSIHQYMQLFYN